MDKHSIHISTSSRTTFGNSVLQFLCTYHDICNDTDISTKSLYRPICQPGWFFSLALLKVFTLIHTIIHSYLNKIIFIKKHIFKPVLYTSQVKFISSAPYSVLLHINIYGFFWSYSTCRYHTSKKNDLSCKSEGMQSNICSISIKSPHIVNLTTPTLWLDPKPGIKSKM